MITHWRSVQRLVFSSYVALQYTGGTRAQASFATYQLWQQLGAEAHKATYLPGGVNRDHSCGARQARRHDRADARQPAAAHLEARERLRATCARAAGRASRLTQTGLGPLAFTPPPLLSHLATYLPTY